MSASIDRVLREAVERGDAPFVVAMAGDRDGVIYEGAAGNRRVDTGDAVTPDSMMRIASMTKMVTTVAALQLTEQGGIDLDTPVERYCPEFGAVSVVSGRIRGLTNTVPLHIEVLYQEYDIAAAFGVATLLAGVALLTIILRAGLDWRGEALRARGSQARLAVAA